jgi:Holliday junction resolvase RusA-like endonuclease
MAKRVKFIVLGEPQGKGRPRFGARYSQAAGRAFVNVRTPEKTVAYENLVKIEYGMQTQNFRFEDGSQLDMRIMAYYGIPKSASKKKKAAMIEGRIRPTKKPDMDNVVKIIADSLNQIAYKDDTQIVDCQCRKFYGEEPRVEVMIQEVGNG